MLRRLLPAFSLTEVVIAMGVAAVAFTSIIGLFPLGLGMSKESHESTQAALIAKSLMNQAIDAQGGSGNTGFRRIAVTPRNDPSLGTNLVSFNANSYVNPTNVYIGYAALADTNGSVFWKPLSTGNPLPITSWSNGVPNCTALVRMTFCRILTGGAANDIHRVEVQVDYPGNLPYAKRSHEIFTRICH